jgi:hypothetical protein
MSVLPFTLLQAPHELGQVGSEFCWRATGGVDHRQDERAILLRIMDAFGEAIRAGLLSQPLAPILVGTVQQQPGTDRPVRQLIGRAHGKEHDRQVGHRRHDGADQLPVGGPGLRVLGDLARPGLPRAP